MRTKQRPSAEYLRECFEYNPETGELRWKERPREHFASDRGWNIQRAKYAGQTVSHQKGGYVLVRLDHVLYHSHRLIWKMVYGVDPLEEIDHINRVPSDNRIDNLRLANRSTNMANTSMYKSNKSGHKGVYWVERDKLWFAYIGGVKNKHRRVGYFKSKDDAIAARARAVAERYGAMSGDQT